MKQMKAVELVRRIRDEQYELLKDKSPDEVKAFFAHEATAAKAEAERMLASQSVSLEQSSGAAAHEAA